MSDETTPRLPESDPHRAHRGSLPVGTPNAIGRYQVLRLLGGGTFGRVYLAFDPEIERYVAVKMPRVPPESHREFLREARIVAQLHHPNICPVYDVGSQNELPFIVMRYVAGGTLDNVLKRSLPTPEKALRITEQFTKGLEAAHARGVFHRDLKPANVLYDEEAEELLITDFGLARWTESSTQTTGGIKGTPAYMAPEQWGPEQFGAISARTDLYSLGVVLFRMLTGIPLFPGDSQQQMFAHCFTPPRKPSDVNPAIGTLLDVLCLKALAKQPAERYASAREFAEAIANCLHPPRKQKWWIPVPGTWYSCLAGAIGVEWQEVAETPGEITAHADEVYKLSISPRASDTDLVSISHLRALPSLRTLDLTSCDQITDAGVAHLKTLISLQEVFLPFCEQITDEGVSHLKTLTSLESLDLTACEQITDASVLRLKTFTNLQALRLVCCNQITDAGIAHLRALTNLRWLLLSFCNRITDASVLHLKALINLEVLKLLGCKQITDAGVAELQRALPNCKIER